MFLAEISRRRIPDWNQRVLTEADAIAYCKVNKLCLVDDKAENYGRIVFYKGHVFILRNPHLPPATALWVLWHEIGHFILHAPQSSRFNPLVKRKSDREANYVAAVAMMPRHLIYGRSIAQVQHDFGYPPELVRLRYEIFTNEDL